MELQVLAEEFLAEPDKDLDLTIDVWLEDQGIELTDEEYEKFISLIQLK